MWTAWLLYGACCVAWVLALADVLRARKLAWGFTVPKIQPVDAAPYFEKIFEHTGDGDCRHAAAFGGAGFVWFEGTREAAEDVKIRQVDLSTGEISDFFDTKELTQAIAPRQTVRVLGNTIGTPTGAGSFIATTVSFGGWAGSSLALGERTETALTAKRLFTHAYLNRSHLVRSPIIPLQDGDWLLPAYFEAKLCVGEMIRLSPDGTLRWKARIGQGRQLIQPCIHVIDSQRAFALCRSVDGTRRLYRSETQDGGRSWSRPTLTDLPCPDAPIALAPLSGGRILMAYNPSDTQSIRLRLSISDDEGVSWTQIHEFISGKEGIPKGTLRYPALKADGEGGLTLAFTAKSKQAVLAFTFNEAWVEAQL